MTEPLPPDDRELERYLQGDSRLSRRYREASRETAPPELDEAVLAQARAELRRKRGPNPWLASVALAASVVLGVNLAWNLREVERVAPAVPVPAERAPEPAATAPQRVLRDELARQQEQRARRKAESAELARASAQRQAQEERLEAEGDAAAAAAPPAPLALSPSKDPQELKARAASVARGALPAGWYLLGESKLYEAAVDEATHRSPPDSFVLWRTAAGVRGCARLETEQPAERFRGQETRARAFVRTQGVHGSNAMMFISFARGGIVQWPLQTRRFGAQGEWREREVVMTIPDNAERIVYGALLCGPGTLWLDDAVLELAPPEP